MSEGRVRNFLKNFHNNDNSMIAVTHGDYIWATRLVMEGWSDEDFLSNDSDPAYKIHNCIVIKYSFPDPALVGEGTVQVSYPIETLNNEWEMFVGKEKRFQYSKPLNNEELLRLAESSHRHF